MEIQPLEGYKISCGNTKVLIDDTYYYVNVYEVSADGRLMYIRLCVISGGNGLCLTGLVLHGYMDAYLTKGQVIKAAESTERPIFQGTELVNAPQERPSPCPA
jgi:hypothetical protein